MNELLGLFRYRPGSGRALLAGTLPLRYCAARFASRTSTWRLLASGHVVDLVAAAADVDQEAVVDGARRAVHWVSGSGPRRKRIRLNRNPPAHLAFFMVQSSPRAWMRLRHVGHLSSSIPDPKRSVLIRMIGDTLLIKSGLGWDDSLGLCTPTSPGLHL